MAGGKKKSLANKLAKMSDEERARYLQHKADMEEEAKRRKEQLIATFMKKKIKNEDAFSRLNLAKINQNWHQILRKAKCQEMKENVGHLKTWIERLLDYKNRTISKLMKELEEVEEQYSNNFQYHSIHIHSMIDHQQKYIGKLQAYYDEDVSELLESNDDEIKYISKSSENQENHLKTVIYSQETEGQRRLREQYENHMAKYYETEKNLQEKLARMRSSREKVWGVLWREIAAVVRQHVQHTDTKRLHYAELRRIDAESALEIADNEERIRQEEVLLEELKKNYDDMVNDRENTIKNLNIEVENLNRRFLKAKIDLKKQLQLDEKKLFFLSECGAKTLGYLEKLAKRGEQIKFLAKTCKKFETERERITRWLPVTNTISKYEGDDPDFKQIVKTIANQMRNGEKIVKSLRSIRDCALPVLKFPREESARKTKTSAAITIKSKPSNISSTSTPAGLAAISGIQILARNFQDSQSFSASSSSTSSEKSGDVYETCYSSLEKLENFWFVFNKAQIDFMQIKEEKKFLEKENRDLKNMIKVVLEQVVLTQSVPNTRARSRRLNIRSAPVRNFSFGSSVC